MSHIEPTFFGPGGRLFGCLHRPAAAPSLGVVLVSPVFGEQVQFHRALFTLAQALAGRGLAVLRYDHLGTGDSAAGLGEAGVAVWQDDVLGAAKFLGEATGVTRVSLMGARIGAALVLEAAPRLARLHRIACWSPIPDGRTYLAALAQAHRKALGSLLAPGCDRLPDPAGTWDILGFEIPQRLHAEISALAPRLAALPPSTPILLLDGRDALAAWPAPAGFDRVRATPVEHPAGWLDPEDGTYDVLTPVAAVDAMLEFLSR